MVVPGSGFRRDAEERRARRRDAEALLFQAPNDLAGHAVDREIRAVDDVRVLRDDERRSAARAVELVALEDGILQPLARAALGAHFGRGVDVKLEPRVGKDRGADVAAL